MAGRFQSGTGRKGTATDLETGRLAAGELGAAEARAIASITTTPGPAHAALARLAIGRGDVLEAHRELGLALEHGHRPGLIGSAGAYFHFVRTALEAGRSDLALDVIQWCLARAESDHDQEWAAHYRISLSTVLEELGRYPEAFDQLRRILPIAETWGGSIDRRFNRAASRHYDLAGDVHEALYWADRALTRHAESVAGEELTDLHLSSGNCRLKIHDTKTAEQHHRTILRLLDGEQPIATIAFLGVDEAHRALLDEQFDLAEDQVLETLRLLGGEIPGQVAEAYTILGRIHTQTNRDAGEAFQTAFTWYGRAGGWQAELAGAREWYAAYLFEHDRADEADAELRAAAELRFEPPPRLSECV